jgi:pyruvate,orthophosphate dikinase
MVPQICSAKELSQVKVFVDEIRAEIESGKKLKLRFKYGTMIEVVRACLTGQELSSVAEFFSFGTNDLTQATFSFSREDAENKFLPFYIQNNIIENNPFEVLDSRAMGKLMRMAVTDGRKGNPELKVGICGEHGGHPESIAFCHSIGLNYVSCSGPRVPVARLAVAHAKLGERKYSSD